MVTKLKDEKACNLGDQAWIGFKKAANKYEWSDGSPKGYLNWAAPEPNNEDGVEACATFMTTTPCLRDKGVWNDYICKFKLQFICKQGQLLDFQSHKTNATPKIGVKH